MNSWALSNIDKIYPSNPARAVVSVNFLTNLVKKLHIFDQIIDISGDDDLEKVRENVIQTKEMGPKYHWLIDAPESDRRFSALSFCGGGFALC